MNKCLPIQTSQVSCNDILINPTSSMGSPKSVRISQNTDSLIHLHKSNGGIYVKQNVIRFCVCYTKEYYPVMRVYSVGNRRMKEYAALEE
jgi:hypothetical protein